MMKAKAAPFLGISVYKISICIVLLLALAACSSTDSDPIINGPAANPYLASSLYAITHFDPSQSDSTPYGPPRGTFNVDALTKPACYGGPINIITLASTNPDYMWQVGSDRVSYVRKSGGQWIRVAKFEALADATGNDPIPDANFRTFMENTAVGMDVSSMDTFLKSLLGNDYNNRFGNGMYVLVDKDNVLYANYGNTLYGLALSDPNDPSAGITVHYKIEDMVDAIQGSSPPPPPGTRLFGLSMAFDGHLIVTFSNGVAVIDRDLNLASKTFYRFTATEYVSNSIAVDDKNGIYVASGSATGGLGTMRKLVWTGTEISDKESDGAWSSPYESSGIETPPIIKVGNGTGSTPTLMGYGSDPDKLVVITDGAKQMKLIAFWRDNIPAWFVQKPGTLSRRIAGQIQVTCGFSPMPEWIQSEQSVVVYKYGAFVVNNIPQTVNPDIQSAKKILAGTLMGPAYPTSYGAERFQWDPVLHQWKSVWARPDVSSTSMVPIHSQSSNMALINGYRDENGWEILGLDWNSGDIVHQTIFGDQNFGNGAYAILQYLANGDLLFNTFAGPIRIDY